MQKNSFQEINEQQMLLHTLPGNIIKIRKKKNTT